MKELAAFHFLERVRAEVASSTTTSRKAPVAIVENPFVLERSYATPRLVIAGVPNVMSDETSNLQAKAAKAEIH